AIALMVARRRYFIGTLFVCSDPSASSSPTRSHHQLRQRAGGAAVAEGLVLNTEGVHDRHEQLDCVRTAGRTEIRPWEAQLRVHVVAGVPLSIDPHKNRTHRV